MPPTTFGCFGDFPQQSCGKIVPSAGRRHCAAPFSIRAIQYGSAVSRGDAEGEA
jgi:hypothetical protein